MEHALPFGTLVSALACGGIAQAVCCIAGGRGCGACCMACLPTSYAIYVLVLCRGGCCSALALRVPH